MATLALHSANFDEVVASHDIVLIDFWAGWCGPCLRFAPTYEAASITYPDIVFGKVDTEAEQELAGRFGIQSIPTLMVFREQVLIFAQAGALPAHVLEDLITKVKELDMDQVRSELSQDAKG
jgi:thioredoxin 1